jgi:hypothetical protein
MMDSAPSAIVSAQSPVQPAPAPPVINSVTFNKLVATIVVTLPVDDVNGEPLKELTNVKIFCGLTGTLTPESIPIKEFPGGSYSPGSQQTVEVNVPAWNTMYDFEAEVSI